MAENKLTVGELVYKISGDMDSLRSEIKKSETEVGNLKSAMEKTTSSTASMGKQSEGTALSVFKGVFAFEALKQGVMAVTQFLGSAIKESADAARILAQVQTNVENAGFAYADLADEIGKTSEAALQLGFDDDTASESLSKLLLVTKDMSQAQALLALSMDLSRSKNISLEQATKAITLVTQGNNKVLKEYGINLDDTASVADQLREAQDKLKNSAVAYSDTVAGKLAIQEQRWGNIKQAVGDKLQPIMLKFFDMVERNQPAINDAFEVFTTIIIGLGFAVEKVIQVFGILFNSLKSTVAQIEGFTTKAGALVSLGLEKVGLSSKSTTASINAMGDSMLETGKKSSDAANNGVKQLFGMSTELDTSVKSVNKTLDDTGKNLAGIGKNSKASVQDIAEAKKALEDFQNKMIGVIDKAKEVKKALEKELGEAFKNFSDGIKANAKDTVDTLAKMVVDSTSKIAELRTKLSAETDAERRTEIEKEIAGQQKILDARVGFEDRQKKVLDGLRKQLADANIDGSKIGLDNLLNTQTLEQQIAEEKRLSTLNEFQLFEEEQNKKLQSLTTALITEVNLLKSKIDTETKFEADLTAYLQSEQSKRLKGTEAWAKGMIKQYKDVADSLQTFLTLQSRVSGLNSAVTLPTSGAATSSVPQTVSNSATTTNKTINAPITINASTTSQTDWSALARDMGFLLSKQ